MCYHSGFEGVFMSRPLLEQHVRWRVHAVPNVPILAAALDRLLRQLSTRSVDGLWRECSRAAATVASIRWDVVSGEGFRFRETTGAGPAPVQLINRYAGQVQRVLTRPHASSRVLTRLRAPARAQSRRLRRNLALPEDEVHANGLDPCTAERDVGLPSVILPVREQMEQDVRKRSAEWHAGKGRIRDRLPQRLRGESGDEGAHAGV